MSWAEVSKINSDFNTPLNLLSTINQIDLIGNSYSGNNLREITELVKTDALYGHSIANSVVSSIALATQESCDSAGYIWLCRTLGIDYQNYTSFAEVLDSDEVWNVLIGNVELYNYILTFSYPFELITTFKNPMESVEVAKLFISTESLLTNMYNSLPKYAIFENTFEDYTSSGITASTNKLVQTHTGKSHSKQRIYKNYGSPIQIAFAVGTYSGSTADFTNCVPFYVGDNGEGGTYYNDAFPGAVGFAIAKNTTSLQYRVAPSSDIVATIGAAGDKFLAFYAYDGEKAYLGIVSSKGYFYSDAVLGGGTFVGAGLATYPAGTYTLTFDSWHVKTE